MVYVSDGDGKPLMPAERYDKIRHLLNDKKDKVVKKNLFAIHLLYDSTRYTQPSTLGVDAGSKQMGLSASSEDKELLAWDVQNRRDITKLISTRREARHTRRNRETRYRAPRFNNRVRTKHKGWLAPSVECKIGTHLHCIEEVQKLLPVTRVVVETASLDTQKLKNPEISGTEYQNGDQKGFWNVREYVLFRDQHCHGKTKDPVLNVHRIESRKTGGNSPSNLVTLCETGHHEYHDKIKSVKFKGPEDFKLPKPYRDAAFMGIMCWTLLERLKQANPDLEVVNTYGYLTKNKRIELNLAKEHYNNAYYIAGNLNAKPLKQCLDLKKTRRHNRQIHKFNFIKGHKRKSNQTDHMVGGFCLFDKIKFEGQECLITGRRKSGSFVLKTLSGQTIHRAASIRKIVLAERANGYLKETRIRQFIPTQTA